MVIPFIHTRNGSLPAVVALKLDKIAQRIKKTHGMTFSCAPSLIDQIAENCTAVEAGARNADAVIDQSLLPGISRQLLLHLGEEDKEYTHLHIGATEEGDFEIIFSEEGDLVEGNGSDESEEKTDEAVTTDA